MLSSDEVVHAILRDPAVVEEVAGRFGDAVRAADGGLDRPALGAVAFAEEGGLRFLEGVVHPRVERRRVEWIGACDAASPRPPLLVCEVPLLFEAGLEDRFDAVLVVTASDGVRRERVEARGQRFAERSGHQVDEAVKVARADRHFVNDGSVGALEAWVAERFAEYAGRPCGAGR